MVFGAGPRDASGRWRIETSVCPSRLLAEDNGAALEFVEWWLSVTHFDGMSGAAGLPEWPIFGRSMLRQPARIVECVEILRAEWPHVLKARAAPQAEAK